MPRFDTLKAALDARLRDDRSVILIDGDDNQHSLSFAMLRRHAVSLLGALQRRGVAVGDAVILFADDNQSFLEAFWACVLGGFVPVPVAVGISDESRRKLLRIFAQFDSAWVYSTTRTMERIDAFAASEGLHDIHGRLMSRLLLIGALDVSGGIGNVVEPAADDVALIQYSSGSTSEPKGVVLTHRNVTANIASIIEATEFTERDMALSWMPLSHDMGLIGFHLTALASGATHAVMRTDLFARRPLLWLKKAAELRATVLYSPNFGYQHYLKQYELKGSPGLDLSAVRMIINGAEPISAALCDRFLRAMTSHRLRAGVMYPVYGLAEASVAVTCPKPGAPMEVMHLDRHGFRVGQAIRPVAPEDAQSAAFVKLGRPIAGTRVRVTDDSGVPQGDAVLGHVQIQGENVTRGYYRDDAATAQAVTPDGWLDTGDLGFLTAGQLVITGRSKDIIFVNGQNYYPHDLERIAERLPGLEVNKVVAVGARNARTGTEDLVIFLLHRGELSDFAPKARELRRIINQQTGLDVAQLLPVKQIPKTTSGKLQRHVLAREYEQGVFDETIAALRALLDEAGEDPAADPGTLHGTARRLKEIFDRLIPDKHVTAQTDFFKINLNSLTLARLHEAIDREFPGRLEVTDLFDYPTLAQLADFIDTRPT